MALLRRTVTSGIDGVGDREFEAIAATSALQADGFALDMSGADLSRFRDGGPLLVEHDPAKIAGNVYAHTSASALLVRGAFPDLGVSALADETCALVKAGVRKWLSIGFEVNETQPIDPQRPRDGVRATRWCLLEVSLVSVALDPKAIVTKRAALQAETGSERLRKTAGHLDRAIDKMRTVGGRHDKISSAIDRLDEHRAAARAALRSGNTDRALKHLSRLSDELTALGQHVDEATDAHRIAHRAVGHAAAHVRALLDAGAEADIEASHTIQTSSGVGVDHGSSPRSYGERQRDLARLSAPFAGRPVFDGDAAKWGAEMRAYIERGGR